MKILDLPLKKQWYQMIESGIKTEEYREIKPYWTNRLIDWSSIITNKPGYDFSSYIYLERDYPTDYDAVRFRYGYTKRTMLFKLNRLSVGVGKRSWGAPDYHVLILHIGERIYD
jgi:hypothetical protein